MFDMLHLGDLIKASFTTQSVSADNNSQVSGENYIIKDGSAM